MTPAERRASLSLASIYMLRMLGLFLVLPVFALAARDYQGGDDPALIGLALGVYGLTQAMLQWPLGMASDRFGRKRVIVLGLLVFAAGAVVAALADSVWGLVVGRAVQGAGAVSAAVTALLADHTRNEVRTKAMAVVGIGIGATFSLALVLGPLLGNWLGLAGLFWLIAMLALLGVAVVLGLVPPEPRRAAAGSRATQGEAAAAAVSVSADAAGARTRRRALLRLNVGVFVLHALQMAMWSGVPRLLEAAGLAPARHWQLYLPAVLASAVFFGAVFALERRGRSAAAMALGIGLVLLAQLLLAALSLGGPPPGQAVLALLGVVLFAFFCGFNALEAMQPSHVSRLASPARRGAALGIYSTLQSLGLFVGGVAGGWLVAHRGEAGLFLATALLALAWLVLALTGRDPQTQAGH